MLNHVDLMGRLVRDPDLRYTQSEKAVCSWTMAVDRDFQGAGEKQTDFLNCMIWNQGAEFVSRHFAKGQMMALSGRLQTRKWEDKDGKKHYETEIVCENVYFCGEKKQKQTFEDVPADDGDLPF